MVKEDSKLAIREKPEKCLDSSTEATNRGNHEREETTCIYKSLLKFILGKAISCVSSSVSSFFSNSSNSYYTEHYSQIRGSFGGIDFY